MSELKITHYGIIHCIARCDNCDWDGDGLPSAKVRKKAKQHASKEGHTVHIETGSSTKYEPSTP